MTIAQHTAQRADVQCRPLRPTDITAVVNSIEQVHRDGGIYPPAQDLGVGREGIRAWLMDESAEARWVAVVGDRVVGHVLVAPPHSYLTAHLASCAPEVDPGELLEVGKLFVSPSARGSGAGTALLHTARRYARTRGRRLALAVVDSSVAARRLYARDGFEPAGEFVGIHGLNHVLLDSAL